MINYNLNHLKELEAESIFVIREVAATFQNPVLLFSGGKDSIVLTHLARKAFFPASIPFPLMHATTVFWCTSNPQPLSTTVSISMT